MKSIMVTTDLSDHSEYAIPVAVDLAKKLGAQLHVVAIIEDPSGEGPLTRSLIHDEIVRDITHGMRVKLQPLVVDLPEDHVTFVVQDRHGSSVAEEIVKYARAHHNEIIVLCTHGRSGMSRALIGSVAEQVVRSSSCPVLTVPPPSRFISASGSPKSD